MTTSKLLSAFFFKRLTVYSLSFSSFFFVQYSLDSNQCTKMKHKSPQKKKRKRKTVNRDERVPFFSALLEPLRFRTHILTACLVFTFDLDLSKKKKKQNLTDKRTNQKNSVSFSLFWLHSGPLGGKTSLGCSTTALIKQSHQHLPDQVVPLALFCTVCPGSARRWEGPVRVSTGEMAGAEKGAGWENQCR